jgi:hypothetical protein
MTKQYTIVIRDTEDGYRAIYFFCEGKNLYRRYSPGTDVLNEIDPAELLEQLKKIS